MDSLVNPLHIHRCWVCDDELWCACADKRSTDRSTGKEQRILCEWCAGLKEFLQAVYGDKKVELERMN